MRALVLIAHPCDDSFTHVAAGTAVTALRAAGHHVDVIDLYAAGFRAAMSYRERIAYETNDPISDPARVSDPEYPVSTRASTSASSPAGPRIRSRRIASSRALTAPWIVTDRSPQGREAQCRSRPSRFGRTSR